MQHKGSFNKFHFYMVLWYTAVQPAHGSTGVCNKQQQLCTNKLQRKTWRELREDSQDVETLLMSVFCCVLNAAVPPQFQPDLVLFQTLPFVHYNLVPP